MEESLEKELCKAEKGQEHTCERGKQNQDFAEFADEQQIKKKNKCQLVPMRDQGWVDSQTGAFAALSCSYLAVRLFACSGNMVLHLAAFLVC